MQSDKWARKEYMKRSDSDTVKYIMKISSHNYSMASED